MMKNPFQNAGADYAASRPDYPTALVEYLASLCPQQEQALDVGCGSGQFSLKLAGQFRRVMATDVSQGQIDNAAPTAGITYMCEPAESISLATGSADLIVAAQAAHWFDLNAFYEEVRRVGKNGAVVALISYGVLEIAGPIGDRFREFYWGTLHEYWPPERVHVEQGYAKLPFPFKERELPKFEISRTWRVAQLQDYINTWSALNAAPAKVLATEFFKEIEKDINGSQYLEATWPIVGRVGYLRGGRANSDQLLR